MADATLVTPAPRKHRSWLRAIAWILGILIVLLVVAYFAATSSAFFKSVILPRVSKAINAQVTVSDASISPFSQVILHNLRVQPMGAEPLATAAEVRLRYSLMDIIKGNIHVDEAVLVSPVVTLVEDPQGHSNLDPLRKAPPEKAVGKPPAVPSKPSYAKQLQIDLKKVALTDATISRVKNYANGTRDVVELSHINLTLDDLKNGQTARLALGADIGIQQTNTTLQAKLAGNFTLALTPDLKPASIKGSTRVDVTKAEGALADAAALGAELNVEVTPTDLKEVALHFQKANATLGELRVSGPFDSQKLEGRLSIVLAGVDKQLLNLVGAQSGLDFGSTTISSTNELELAKAGSMITVKGQLDVGKFQLTRLNQTTPRLDVRNDYDLTVDREQSMVTLRALTLTGTQTGNTLLKAELTNPLQIPLANTNVTLGDAALTVAVTNFNLADWKPFLGDVAPQGVLNATAKVWSHQGDKQIALALDARVDHLTVSAGSNHISDATISLQANGKAANLSQFSLTDYKLGVAHQNETLVTASGSGTYDKASEDADMQVTLDAALAPLLRTVPQPDMTISSGTLEMKAHVTRKQKTQALMGNLALAGFTGRFGTNEVRSLGTTVDFDIGMASQQVQVRKLAGKLTQGGNAAGSFDVSGTYDSGTTNADVQATVQLELATLAQVAPRPGVSISSGTVELKTHLAQKPNNRDLAGSLALAGFSARIGTNEVRNLGTATDFDIGMAAQKVQIRKLAGKLTQGGNAAGSFDVSGTYDSGTTNADVQAKVQLVLAALAQAVPQPGMTVSSGTADLTTHATQKQNTQAITGNLALADFTGRMGTNEVRSLGMAVDFDIGMASQQVQIRKLAGKLAQGGNAGGSFDVSGTYDSASTKADLKAKLTDLNQHGLGPFIGSALGDKQLTSVAINANATAQIDPQGSSAVKADLQVTNLVVKDPTGQFPATPLEAKMQVDVSLSNQVASVRQFQIALTPTSRATNQVQLSGQLDMSQTNAIQGNLKLAADSLDFTSYYDLFMGGKQAPQKAAAPATPQSGRTSTWTPARADAQKEPDPIKLPLHNFTASASVRRFYLHEVDIADWETTATIDGGRVVLNPFKLTLNGAPVNTTLNLDLGVPGYKYDASLSALAVPLAPLVNSFQPDRKGILSGTLTAQVKLGGAGTTGTSLKKSLTGQFDIASTNLNLSVDNIRGDTFYTRLLKTLAKTIAALPDLVNNPGGTATPLLQGLTGLGSTSSSNGASAEAAKSPINSIILSGTAGSGRVNLQKAVIQSPSFEAQASGTITLADVLTNSPLQIPISVSIERSVAQRIKMAGNTPTNAVYAKLPDFLTMKGTLGNSTPSINYLALASAGLQGAGGGGQAGAVVQGLSTLLGGGTNANSNAGTNQPGGGKAGGLLQGLGSLLGSSTGTNTPATNQPPAGNLLDGLFGPKKK